MPKSNVILTQDQATKLQQIYNIIIPLPASGWTGDTAPFSQQISVGGITDAQIGEMFLQPAGDTPTEAEETAYTALDNAESGDGFILFKTKAGVTAKPTTDITVRLTGLTTPGDTTAAGVAGMQAEIEGIKSDMSDSGWLLITTEYQPIHYRKVGKLVQFYFWNDKAIPLDTTIAQIPEGYRPKLPFYPNAMVIRDAFAGGSKISISENGLVKADSEIESTNWTFFYATWLV